MVNPQVSRSPWQVQLGLLRIVKREFASQTIWAGIAAESSSAAYLSAMAEVFATGRGLVKQGINPIHWWIYSRFHSKVGEIWVNDRC